MVTFNFNIVITLIALIILIVFLIVVGIMFYLNQFKKTFPPVIADCPDYWLAKSENDILQCVNVNNTGNNNCPKSMNFSKSEFQGSKGLCRKYKWAKGCDVSWDGISQLEEQCS